MANLRIPQNWQSPSNVNSLINWMAGASIDGACLCAYMVSAIGNTIIGVTSWSNDLTGVPGYPGITFRSTTGMTASKAEHPSGTDAANVEADVFISSLGITEADVQAGKWDGGACTLFRANANDLSMGQLIVAKGRFSQFKQIGQIFRTELQGHNQALRQRIGRVTSLLCSADVYDSKCKLDAVARGEVHTVTLSQVTSQTQFRASSLTQGAEYFDNAKGGFDTGNNAGFEFHVNTWDSSLKEFVLRRAMPFVPQVGDQITVFRGCKKRKQDCVDRDNIINMRAQPDIPTIEEFLRLPTV